MGKERNSAGNTINTIRRKHSAEEKIRIVQEGLRSHRADRAGKGQVRRLLSDVERQGEKYGQSPLPNCGKWHNIHPINRVYPPSNFHQPFYAQNIGDQEPSITRDAKYRAKERLSGGLRCLRNP